MKESLTEMVKRLSAGMANPNRYLVVTGKNIPWSEKDRIQSLFYRMEKHIQSLETDVQSLLRELAKTEPLEAREK